MVGLVRFGWGKTVHDETHHSVQTLLQTGPKAQSVQPLLQFLQENEKQINDFSLAYDLRNSPAHYIHLEQYFGDAVSAHPPEEACTLPSLQQAQAYYSHTGPQPARRPVLIRELFAQVAEPKSAMRTSENVVSAFFNAREDLIRAFQGVKKLEDVMGFCEETFGGLFSRMAESNWPRKRSRQRRSFATQGRPTLAIKWRFSFTPLSI